MSHSLDVLCFVEDPGAANYIAGIPEELTARGYRVKLLADGFARNFLSQRNVPFEDVTAHTEHASAEDLLNSHTPRLVVVGTSENPDTMGLALIDACRRAKVPTVGAVDAIANSAYRFRGRSKKALRYAPDWLLAPDPWTKKSYQSLGFLADRIAVCGHPSYDQTKAVAGELSKKDRHMLRKTLFPNLLTNQRVLVFIAEISGGLNSRQFQRSAEYTMTGRGKNKGRSKIVLEEFLDALSLIHPRPYSVLRLHPKNTRDEFKIYSDDFDLVSQDGSPLELIFASDLVVGMTSMLLLEASILGRPTLSIVPRAIEKNWLPTIIGGITPCVLSRKKLIHLLPAMVAGSFRLKKDIQDVLLFNSKTKVIDFIESLL